MLRRNAEQHWFHKVNPLTELPIWFRTHSHRHIHLPGIVPVHQRNKYVCSIRRTSSSTPGLRTYVRMCVHSGTWLHKSAVAFYRLALVAQRVLKMVPAGPAQNQCNGRWATNQKCIWLAAKPHRCRDGRTGQPTMDNDHIRLFVACNQN